MSIDRQTSRTRHLSFRLLALLSSAMISCLLILAVSAFARPTAGAARSIPRGGTAMSLVITNSGSTNMPAARLTIHSDGSATLVYDRPLHATGLKHADRHFPAHTFSTTRLEDLLARIGEADTIPNHNCVKSVSFGSTTTLTYNGKTSGDLSCISSEDTSLHQQIAREALQMYRQAIESDTRGPLL